MLLILFGPFLILAIIGYIFQIIILQFALIWVIIVTIVMLILAVFIKFNKNRNTKVNNISYFSPGSRPSIQKLRIDNNGIYLNWQKIKPNGEIDTFSGNFETKKYNQIKKISTVDARIIKGKTKEITGLTIETHDNFHGVINLWDHNKQDVYRLLKKYFKNNWDEIYRE